MTTHTLHAILHATADPLAMAHTAAFARREAQTASRSAPVRIPHVDTVGAGGYHGGSGSAAEVIEPVLAAYGAEVPEGEEPVDFYATTDFCAGRYRWTNLRYFLSNSSIGLEAVFGSAPGTVGLADNDHPGSVAWDCYDRDNPREAINSPQEFDSAQDSCESLLARADGRGRPIENVEGSVQDLTHQAVFYGLEALVEPVRVPRIFNHIEELDGGVPTPSLNAIDLPHRWPRPVAYAQPVYPVPRSGPVRPSKGANLGVQFESGVEPPASGILSCFCNLCTAAPRFGLRSGCDGDD